MFILYHLDMYRISQTDRDYWSRIKKISGYPTAVSVNEKNKFLSYMKREYLTTKSIQ
jgi:hypothetical protein